MPHVSDPGYVGGEIFTCFTWMAEQSTEFIGLDVERMRARTGRQVTKEAKRARQFQKKRQTTVSALHNHKNVRNSNSMRR
jgi:hypothetical protein